jgi:uncharacterized membrane protein YdjX (TVP38/TMEM64 family)
MDTRGADGPGANRRVALRRIGLYLLVLAAAFAALALTGSIPSAAEAQSWGKSLHGFAYVAYVPLFVALNFLITWPILAAAGGLLFGTAAGTPLALAGVTLAALTQMLIARRLASGHHGNLLPERTRSIEEFLTRHGAVAVLESRIVPLLPFGIVNFSAGLTHLRFRDMAVGTVVGAAPKVFAWTALGGNLTDLSSPEAIVAIALLVALAVAGALFVRRRIALGRA